MFRKILTFRRCDPLNKRQVSSQFAQKPNTALQTHLKPFQGEKEKACSTINLLPATCVLMFTLQVSLSSKNIKPGERLTATLIELRPFIRCVPNQLEVHSRHRRKKNKPSNGGVGRRRSDSAGLCLVVFRRVIAESLLFLVLCFPVVRHGGS